MVKENSPKGKNALFKVGVLDLSWFDYIPVKQLNLVVFEYMFQTSRWFSLGKISNLNFH